jgi:curved DNA-binding protein CbpA
MTTDHYEVLGVAPNAGHTEIRAAYRARMRQHHPDLRPGDPGAEEMARRVTAAWTVLGRPSARAAYDRTRSVSRRGAGDPPLARPTTQGPPAYSPVGTDYRRAFHLASLKVAGLVFAVGLLLLAALSR